MLKTSGPSKAQKSNHLFWLLLRCLWISQIEEVKKKLEDEDKRSEASGGAAIGAEGGSVDGVEMEVEPWTTGTGIVFFECVKRVFQPHIRDKKVEPLFQNQPFCVKKSVFPATC